MAKKPQVVNGQVVWVEEGKAASPTGEAAEANIWEHILPETARIFGDLVSGTASPNLTPLGEEQNAQDYILQHLESDPTQEWSWPEEIAKATGRGVTKVFVPKAQVDVGAQALGEASGFGLQGATALRQGVKALQAEDVARTAARQSATQKLQEGARKPGDVWQGNVGGGAPGGYHTQRMKNRQLIQGGEPEPRLPGEGIPTGQRYQGPRPTETEFRQFETGGGEHRGIPSADRPGSTHPAARAREASERAAGRADSHQLDMARYRAGLEMVENMLDQQGRLPTPDEIARIDDPIARQAIEKFVAEQGPVRQGLQEGRQVAGELGDRRDIASELAERRAIQEELAQRRQVGQDLQGGPPTQTAPTAPAPPTPMGTLDEFNARQGAPTQPLPTQTAPTAPRPPQPTDRGATMPPQGGPHGAAHARQTPPPPPTDRGATMPPSGPPGPPTQPMPPSQAPPTMPSPPGRGGGAAATPPPPTQPMPPAPPTQPLAQRPLSSQEGQALQRALDAPAAAPSEVARTAGSTPEADRALARMQEGDAVGVPGLDTRPKHVEDLVPDPMVSANQAASAQDTQAVTGQMEQLQDLPDYGHYRLNVLMQELFQKYPNLTMDQFMQMMRQGGGAAGAPGLPF